MKDETIDQLDALENDLPTDGSDIITGMMETERVAFVEQLGDEKLDKLTGKEWAGFISMYLLEAANAVSGADGEEGQGAMVAKQRHMLLKAYAITNEALRRHLQHSGFPLFSTVELEKAKKENKPLIHVVGKPVGKR